MPNRLFATVTVSNSQPPQSMFLVLVFGGTVIVHPKGEVEVIVLVQVGDAEQDVRVVVPGRVVGGQTWDSVSGLGGWFWEGGFGRVDGGCVPDRTVGRG
jgi:hypothetical protein